MLLRVLGLGFVGWCVGFRLGTAPTQKQSMIRTRLRAIYIYINIYIYTFIVLLICIYSINIVHLLLSGGSS